MKFITEDKDEITIDFEYIKNVIILEGKEQSHPVDTLCFIRINGLPVGEGFAACSKKDNFEYKKGRKIAFKRAMKDADFIKAKRTEIWKKYLTKG